MSCSARTTTLSGLPATATVMAWSATALWCRRRVWWSRWRKQKPGLVFLNTCASLALAMDIQQQVGSMVIGTVLEAPDDEAFVTGVALVTAPAEGMSIEEAFAVSRPGSNRQYVLLGAGESGSGGRDDEADELRMIRFLNQWGQRLEERMDENERSMNQKISRICAARWVVASTSWTTGIIRIDRRSRQGLADWICCDVGCRSALYQRGARLA